MAKCRAEAQELPIEGPVDREAEEEHPHSLANEVPGIHKIIIWIFLKEKKKHT